MNIFCLLGGIGPGGIDGYVTSAGLWHFASTLKSFGNVKIYTWGNWQKALNDVRASSQPNLVIGYSGGGSRATYLAAYANPKTTIDLMILWDPSPKWQMEPIYENVKEVVNFYNTSPMMPSFYGMLGGGQVTLVAENKTTKVIVETIAIQHLLVQISPTVRQKTRQYIQDYANVPN